MTSITWMTDNLQTFCEAFWEVNHNKLKYLLPLPLQQGPIIDVWSYRVVFKYLITANSTRSYDKLFNLQPTNIPMPHVLLTNKLSKLRADRWSLIMDSSILTWYSSLFSAPGDMVPVKRGQKQQRHETERKSNPRWSQCLKRPKGSQNPKSNYRSPQPVNQNSPAGVLPFKSHDL